MNMLNDVDLENSPVVANSSMNRQRSCSGDNSYAKELLFDPINFLQSRLDSQKHVAWLDLCCGTGRALIDAAHILQPARGQADLKIVGVDLVSMFYDYPAELDCLSLQATSVSAWEPDYSFDLITCVHGLHYIGDKLQLLQQAVSWLKNDGIFLAHLDPVNLKFQNGEVAGNQIIKELQKQGLEYNKRKRLLSCKGEKEIRSNYQYIGADDQAGPNYTNQEVVDSFYFPMGSKSGGSGKSTEVVTKKQTINSRINIATFQVRVLIAADAEAYREVRLQALHEHPPAFGSIPEDEPNLSETAERLIASDDRCFFGAFQGEKLIGIVRLSRYEAPNEKHRAFLGGLYVLPAFRRNGCGRALVEQALHRSANIPNIRRINLTVVTQQEAALRLYQSLGFQIYGTEQETFSRAGHFYDEHLLTLSLISS
jgi:RimJ/RimL family protein N-acetyltransferase/2-polyprenyl-3-methyl-5-hydroxy-6-metoxy-1,4-benzoquinol methylase